METDYFYKKEIKSADSVSKACLLVNFVLNFHFLSIALSLFQCLTQWEGATVYLLFKQLNCWDEKRNNINEEVKN